MNTFHYSLHSVSIDKDDQPNPRRTVWRDVLNENKEMIARPAITLIPSSFSLFSLPLVILAFSLGCQNIGEHPLRYLVLTFYFLTFIPSIISFMLYIYPSSFYWKEWESTEMSQRMSNFRNRHPNKEMTMTVTTDKIGSAPILISRNS